MDAKLILEMTKIMLEAVIDGDYHLALNNLRSMEIFYQVGPNEYRTAIGLIGETIERLNQQPTSDDDPTLHLSDLNK
jgi:hypothetical protein